MRGLILIFMMWVLVHGEAGAGGFTEGNSHFKSGEYESAVRSYEQHINLEGPDGFTYYNLGNAHAKAGDLGKEILAYERAMEYLPRDPDLRANLKLARQGIAGDDGGRAGLEGIVRKFSRNEWSWLVAGGALGLGMHAIWAGRYGMGSGGRRKGALVAGLLLIAGIGIGTAALVMTRRDSERGVVANGAAKLLLSPFASAEEVGALEAGMVVMITDHHKGFHRVIVPNSTMRGWVSDNKVEKVIP